MHERRPEPEGQQSDESSLDDPPEPHSILALRGRHRLDAETGDDRAAQGPEPEETIGHAEASEPGKRRIEEVVYGRVLAKRQEQGQKGGPGEKDPGALLREGDADEREEERPDAGIDVERGRRVLAGERNLPAWSEYRAEEVRRESEGRRVLVPEVDPARLRREVIGREELHEGDPDPEDQGGEEALKARAKSAFEQGECASEQDSVVSHLRMAREDHHREGDRENDGAPRGSALEQALDGEKHPGDIAGGEDDRLMPRSGEPAGEHEDRRGGEGAHRSHPERAQEQQHSHAGETLVQELVGFEPDVGDPAVRVEREEEVRRRVEDPDLRIRVERLTAQDVRIPERELERLHPRERIALPDVVLVEKIPSKDLPFVGVGMEELPVEKEREDEDGGVGDYLPQSTWVETKPQKSTRIPPTSPAMRRAIPQVETKFLSASWFSVSSRKP